MIWCWRAVPPLIKAVGDENAEGASRGEVGGLGSSRTATADSGTCCGEEGGEGHAAAAVVTLLAVTGAGTASAIGDAASIATARGAGLK